LGKARQLQRQGEPVASPKSIRGDQSPTKTDRFRDDSDYEDLSNLESDAGGDPPKERSLKMPQLGRVILVTKEKMEDW
jgi:hypothetical protein